MPWNWCVLSVLEVCFIKVVAVLFGAYCKLCSDDQLWVFALQNSFWSFTFLLEFSIISCHYFTCLICSHLSAHLCLLANFSVLLAFLKCVSIQGAVV